MDYLKSAVASAISKGSSIPYAFGDRVDVDQTVFSLYNGTKKVCFHFEREKYGTLTFAFRKMAPVVAYSRSISPPTNQECPWRATLFANSEH